MRSRPKKKTFLIFILIILAIGSATFGYITIEKNQSKRLNQQLTFLNNSWEDKENGYLKNDINESQLKKIEKELTFPKDIFNKVFDKKGLTKKLKNNYESVDNTITLQKDINNLFTENVFIGEGIHNNPIIKKDVKTSDVVKVKDRVEYAKLNNKWNSSATILIQVAMQQVFWNEQVESNMKNLKDQKEIELELFDDTKEAITLIKNEELKKMYLDEIVSLEKGFSDNLISKANNNKKSLDKSTSKNAKYYQDFDSNYQNKINEDNNVWDEKLNEELNTLQHNFETESSKIKSEKPKESTTQSTTQSSDSSGGFKITTDSGNKE